MLAIVPPDAPPLSRLTRILTRVAGTPHVAFACCCRNQTPMSEGTESKPQQCTMRAPDRLAAASWRAIILRIHCASPVRSQ
jgi:hypothetical protein